MYIDGTWQNNHAITNVQTFADQLLDDILQERWERERGRENGNMSSP